MYDMLNPIYALIGGRQILPPKPPTFQLLVLTCDTRNWSCYNGLNKTSP